MACKVLKRNEYYLDSEPLQSLSGRTLLSQMKARSVVKISQLRNWEMAQIQEVYG